MSTTERGRVAEKLAANYLDQRGFRIIARNWHNRYAEIDIIAERLGTIHIIEVKYRLRTDYGGGLEAITPDKVERLRRATLAWATHNHFTGALQIDIISVTGELTHPVIEYLESAIEAS